MSLHILVCPFDEHLLSCLQRRSIVIRLNDPQAIGHAANLVRRQNTLHVILLQSDDSLTSIPFQKEWADIPLAIYISKLDKFREFSNCLPLLHKLDVCIFLPEDAERSYTYVRILSSLGISSGLFFRNQNPNWEAMNDLMHYMVYGRIPHAPIEPFYYLITHYHPNKLTDLSSVYFDNPSHYLHINKGGQIALSYKELISGKFIANNIKQIDKIEQCPAYFDRLEGWRSFFLQEKGCAYCEGWRVCLGKFSHMTDDSYKCKDFFIELMDAADYYCSLEQRQKGIWRL